MSELLKLGDCLLGEWRAWRRWRGGIWFYAACPDGGWMRQEPHPFDMPRIEDWR